MPKTPTTAKRSTRARSTSKNVRATRGSTDAGTPQKSRKAAASKKATPHKKKRDSCFVISPFGGWHDEYHREIFCAAIESVGLEPTRADDLFRSSNIVSDIWHLVSSAKVMLADLTGKNANVFYELGLAHAARKPVLLVTQTMEDVPFDLRALRVITYEVEDPSWGEVLRKNIVSGLNETLASPIGSVLPTFLAETPTAKQPKISSEQKHVLELQRQLDALRSEVRALSVRSPRKRANPKIEPPEAEELIRRFVARKMAPEEIEEQLLALDVPRGWVRDRIVELT
jgi:hypothetical protein